TINAYLYIFNNSNYNSPSTRGDYMVLPVSVSVTIPTVATATLNTASWTTVAAVGSPSTSGSVFTLKNVGQSTLTITSISGLTGTPFTSNFNGSITLAENATHDFGFTFTPTASGVFNATFTIVTNGGTKTITLKGYGNYVTEGFEGATFPPDGWVSNDADADTYNWMQYTATGAAHTGLNCAGSASYVNDSKDSGVRSSFTRGALTPDNWLITPRLTITNGDALNYWIAAQDPAWPAEFYSVKLSTTNNLVASFTNTLFSETLTDGVWANRNIDLSAYAGQSVFIAFQHHNCTDQFVLKLDDVLMPPLAAPLVYGDISGRVRRAVTLEDIAGATITVAGRTTTTDDVGVYSITGIVSDTYELSVSATGYPAYTANVVIPQNSSLTHNVFMDYALFNTANTTINLSVATGQSTNTSISLSNTGTIAVDWTSDSGIWGGDTFLGANLNQDWETSDLTGWAGSVGAYSDIYGSVATPYGYNSQNTWVFAANQTTVVQYLTTPKMRVATGDNLAFWYKQFNNSSETFTVKVSTTDNLYASFTNTLTTIGPIADTNWANYSGSLDAYAGQDIYICFEYPRIDGYQYGYVMLDNITGAPVMASPTEWLSCNPATGTLNASASASVSLIANAATLPIGSYTAETWFFGTAANSPYKVYVNLTVTEALGVDAPQNLIIEKGAGLVAIAWDDVDNANSYKVYGCATPDGEFDLIDTVEGAYIELTDAALAANGLDSYAFFQVRADTASRNTISVSSRKKQSAPLLQNSMRPANTKNSRVLHRM
ncbi:MAG: choice-of-anchor J domain-containing protein, partial [Candidatus Cloacimonetes bacterium]|nr:choice-of-anchor J domain-containing protein [Candidatus Cloacimonadota bacterium]